MKTLQLKPMNRNPFGDGADEMINLRSKNGVLETVGKKKALISGANAYTDMLVHSFDGNTNYIAVSERSIDWIDTETEKVKVKGNIINNLETPIKSVQVVNNTIVFTTDDTMYISYFKSDKHDTEGAYSKAVGGMPLAPAYTGEVTDIIVADTNADITVNPATEAEISDKLNVAYQKYIDENIMTKNKLPEGYIFIRVAYRLTNGSTTLLSSPVLFRIDNNGEWSIFHEKIGNEEVLVIRGMVGGKLKLTINKHYNSDYDNIISGIVVYSTRVLSRFDFSKSSIGLRAAFDFDLFSGMNFYNRNIGKEFDDELYYKIAEIPYTDSSYRVVTVDADLLKDLTSNEESVIDDGYIVKTGDLFMYNKRAHLYNMMNRTSRVAYNSIAPTGVTYGDFLTGQQLASVYAKIDRNNANHYVYLCSIPISEKSVTLNYISTIPYIAESLYIVTDEIGVDRYGIEIPLQHSKRHNYSYSVDTRSPISLTQKFEFPLTQLTQPTAPLSADTYLGKDGDNLIVSEANYPLIYPVQNSYLMPGNIIDLSINTTQITQSQIGQYPLYIFTTAGIYGLEQGQGNVLYARTIPLSIEVAIETCQTPYGIVFSTDNGLKVINGGNITELSLDIDVSLNHDIRNHASFKICTDHEQLCRVQPYISEVDFVAYLKGAVIGYDSREKEVIISNPSRAYSYAYSFLGRYWMKRGESYSWFNGNIALTPMIEGATTRPINLLNEEEIDTLSIVYLTVPLALDDHTTIKRSALRGDFKPTNNHMGVYMFASVDKIHWDAVNAMQFKEDTPHVILPRIATTYRWIVLLVCGDTDGTRLAYLEINDVPKYTGNLR